MKYYIIAGEASGDLHASLLVKEIKALDPEAQFRAWGGDLLSAQGAFIVKHYSDLAFMGFKEVIANLGTILKNIRFCKEDILEWKPDTLIFVDYPGFNIRIAEWARQQGFRTIYYISPQVWAWKEGRAHKLKRDVDKMIVILPFEETFYRRFDFPVTYVGHPLLDTIGSFEKDPGFIEKYALEDKPIIAVLPGSRKQEILKKLPVMMAMPEKFPGYQFIIAGAPGQREDFYRSIPGMEKPRIIFGQTYQLLAHSEAAMVTSGTATLETALFGVPEVVCYKGSSLSYWIGKQLVKVPFISLVNLIMGKMVVRELIQHELNEKNLSAELIRLLHDEAYREEIKKQYAELKEKLGGGGASRRAAAEIVRFIKEQV